MFRRGLYSEQYGYDLHQIFQVPPDDELYRAVTPYTDKCILLVGPTVECKSHSSLGGFQARDGRNQFGDLDMPGDFMHYCADALNKQHGCLRGGAKQPNSALIERSRGSGADAA